MTDLNRGLGSQHGIFPDVATMQAGRFKNGRIIGLISGARYRTDDVDNGEGIPLASGNFALPIGVDASRILGFMDYNDAATSTTPLVVTVAGSPVPLPNDAAGPFTNTAYRPTTVTRVWDEVANEFDWSELSIGDMVDIRLDIDVITTSPNTAVSVALRLGDGAGEYTVPFITLVNLKDADTHKLNRFNGVYMGDANTRDNGGFFEISADADCTCVVNGFYCRVVRRAA